MTVAAMQGRAEIGADAEVPPVVVATGREPIAGRKTCPHDSRIVAVGVKSPGGDDLVADIFVNLPAVFDDRLRDIGDESAEEIEKARLAETLGGRGRCGEIDEQERPLLQPRAMIAPNRERKEDARPKQLGHPEHKISGDGDGKPECDVDEGDRLRAVEQPDEENLDHNDHDEIGSRAQAEIDGEREPAKVRSEAPLESESLQRREGGAENGAERNAGPPGVMREIGIDPPDDGADDGARHDEANEDGVRHLR